MDFDEHLAVNASEMLSDSFVDYTPVSPKETRRIVQLRVRFAILQQ